MLRTLTKEQLQTLLKYDPQTGVFTWLRTGTGKSAQGSKAGHVHARSGYVRISVLAEKYGAHRLAWLYVYGHWPNGEIDHINGNRSDNRIVNLRDVSKTGNQHNIKRAKTTNQTGMLGVSLRKNRSVWVAQIQVDKKKKHLGYFDTAEQAHEAYLSAKRTLHRTNTL